MRRTAPLLAAVALAACGAAEAGAPAADGAATPQTPAVRAVMGALQPLAPRVVACGLAPGEEVHVRVVFASDGHVVAAQAPAGAHEACIEQVLFTAHLAPFRQSLFRVGFPYRAPGVPQTPSRDAVMQALHDGYPPMRACAANGTTHGTFTIVMHFGSDGHVTSVEAPAGTPSATCVVDAVAHIRLPPFQQAAFQVSYPFQL